MKQNNKKIQPFSTIYILFKKKNFTSAWFKKKRGGERMQRRETKTNHVYHSKPIMVCVFAGIC